MKGDNVMKPDSSGQLRAILEDLIAEGLIERKGDRYRITAKGQAISETQWSTDVLPEAGQDYGNA
jgi:predicted transcriptional regulator